MIFKLISIDNLEKISIRKVTNIKPKVEINQTQLG